METHLSHLVFNVQPSNLRFYNELFSFLGWVVLYDGDGMLGMGVGQTSIWFGGQAEGVVTDYDGPGLNHLALGTATQADVDSAVTWLAERGVAALFETPRHRPEFTSSEDNTYYQVMFETPDRILVEIVYIGPKAV